MSQPTLSEDVLERFLQETKAEEEKKKTVEVELPSNYIILDPKQSIKQRRDNALQRLNNLKNRSGVKRTSFGAVVADRAKGNVPSASFKFSKETKDEDSAQDQ